jgi:lipopolysaccharide O-acetyltransferase
VSSFDDHGENFFMRLKGYGLGQIVYLGLSLFFTKIIYPSARLIRLPFFFRISGRISIGKGFTAGRSLRIDVHLGGLLLLGKNVQMNDNCQIACAGQITIGDDVLIASKVFITDHDHDFRDSGIPTEWGMNVAQVTIADGCWLGNGVHILKGVTIGRGTIVGAGSVVTRSFPEFSILAGVPAKLICQRQESS